MVRNERDAGVGAGMRNATNRAVQATRQGISDHLISSVGLCLGVGFGVGLLIGATLADAADRNSRHHRFGHDAREYGRWMLDALSRATPDWLGGKLG
jgi:hypothetical protein